MNVFMNMYVCMYMYGITVQLIMAHTLLQANQKKFVELVATNALRKVEKALATGMDANFLTDDGSKNLLNVIIVCYNNMFTRK